MKEAMEFEGEMGVVKDSSSSSGGGGTSATTSSGGSGRGGEVKKKNRRKLWMFRGLKIKESWKWRWRFLGSAFKWKRHSLQLQLPLLDDLLFKVVSVLEAVVLVAALCFFYLCCGCHI